MSIAVQPGHISGTEGGGISRKSLVAVIVAAVGVVGVPDTRLGETLAAFIVPTDSAHPPRPAELASFTRARLAGFKIPQYWYSVDELPLNSAGKVVRAQLQASHLKRQPAKST